MSNQYALNGNGGNSMRSSIEPIPISHERGEKGNERNENQSLILKNLNDVVTPIKDK